MGTKAILLFVAFLVLGCALDDSSSGSSAASGARAPEPYARPAPSTRAPDPFEAGVERTFSPARGVVCDRSAQICYQDSRASVAQTQAYFGDTAARKLQAKSKAAQPEAKWVFEPDSDTSCDMRTQVCYGSKGPSVKKTRKYFGDAAAARLEQNLGGTGSGAGTITKEKHGVGCDQSVKICYDENGPSVKLTKKYFGEAAATNLKKQLKR